MSDLDPLAVLDDVTEIPAPLGTGPHEVRELESWFPWAVYECRRCGRRAWFRADGFERVACSGDPDPAAVDRASEGDGRRTDGDESWP